MVDHYSNPLVAGLYRVMGYGPTATLVGLLLGVDIYVHQRDNGPTATLVGLLLLPAHAWMTGWQDRNRFLICHYPRPTATLVGLLLGVH